MLAIIDSGIGGVSVWSEVKKLLPHNSLLYYADTVNCPYGVKSVDEIERLTVSVVGRVVDMGADIVVVACNTMTAAAISTLRDRWKNIDFVGMEPAVKPAAQSSSSGVVGILATRATLRGELYHHTRQTYAANVKIIESAGDGLVECVEQGLQNSEVCDALLKKYILPMLEGGADTLVLGCTHYPFLTRAIENVVCKAGFKPLHIINPAPAVARRVMHLAVKRGIAGVDINPKYSFISSGGKEEEDKIKKIALSE